MCKQAVQRTYVLALCLNHSQWCDQVLVSELDTIAMNDVECNNVSLALLSEGTCAASGIHLVFIVVPIALLLIVAGVVIMCKVVSVQKRKKAKSRFVRYTSVRGSKTSSLVLFSV